MKYGLKLTGVRGNNFVINPAFVRHYGHLFTIEGLEFISKMDGSQLHELIMILHHYNERQNEVEA